MEEPDDVMIFIHLPDEEFRSEECAISFFYQRKLVVAMGWSTLEPSIGDGSNESDDFANVSTSSSESEYEIGEDDEKKYEDNEIGEDDENDYEENEVFDESQYEIINGCAFFLNEFKSYMNT
ncbi:hypothetical protein L1887_41934 [Cichorium endivia]|nr:hypothetical protein L1887_41934 [Cichorium endivia]